MLSFPFMDMDLASLLARLFEKATHIPIWILSLGNAVVGIEELAAKMAKHGRQTRAIALRYQHLPAVATAEKKEANREFLVVGWDPNAPLLRSLSVDQAGLGDHAVGGDLDDAVPGVHADADTGSPERPAAEPLPVDAFQEGDASLPEQAASKGRGLPVPELQPGVNGPDAILPKTGLDGDGERRVGTSGIHAHNVP